MFQAAAAATVAAPLLFSAAAFAQDGTFVAAPPEPEVAADVQGAFQQQAASPGNGSLTFDHPELLFLGLGLIGLWFLRKSTEPPATPASSTLTHFLVSLKPEDETPHQTPLWQRLLTVSIGAGLLLAAAQPRFDPDDALQGQGPLVMVIDNGWASAPNWDDHVETMQGMIDRSERDGRLIMVLPTAQPADGTALRGSGMVTPSEARRIVSELAPMPWPSDSAAALEVLNEVLTGQGTAVWLSSGLGDDSTRPLAERLSGYGPLTVIEDTAQDSALLLLPPQNNASVLSIGVRRATGEGADQAQIIALAADGREIARSEAVFGDGEREKQVMFDVPAEIRNRIERFVIEGERSAGAVLLMDERWRRRPVGLITSAAARPAQPLLDEFHYVDRALDPFADVREGTVETLLQSEIAVLVMGDSYPVEPQAQEDIEQWVENGGTLLRFAGPRVAEQRDGLLPVELRTDGARTIGGTVSWADAAGLAPFDEGSPFYGIEIPEDVVVQRQVLTQQGTSNDAQVWARLEDGTPLVSAQQRGKGYVVLVHTGTSDQWSNLSISGVFVDMLRAMVAHSQGVGGGLDADQVLPPWKVLDGQGRYTTPENGVRGLTAAAIENGTVSAQFPPGFYGDRDSGGHAHNLAAGVRSLEPLPELPSDVIRKTFEEGRAMNLTGLLLGLAVALALADHAATLAQRRGGPSRRRESGNAKAAAPAKTFQP